MGDGLNRETRQIRERIFRMVVRVFRMVRGLSRWWWISMPAFADALMAGPAWTASPPQTNPEISAGILLGFA